VLTNGRHRSIFHEYRVDSEISWEKSDYLIAKYEYVTFQTYFLSLLVKEKDE